MDYPKIILKKKREASILRKHPWVFSGAIHKIVLPSDIADIEEGALVHLCDYNETVMASGYFSMGSIAVRILAFEERTIDQTFWDERISEAFELRKKLQLVDDANTNCYRLVHAEGDGLAGLIIDIYDRVAVVQAHSLGIANSLQLIKQALLSVYSNELQAIYSKSEKSMNLQSPHKDFKDNYLHAELDCPHIVLENKLQFEIDWIKGQKTGFFIDQRVNRKLLMQYAKNKKVLNTFCYSGGFSVYALEAGAALVHSVDSSQLAIDLSDRNVEINYGRTEKHQSFVQDTLSFLTSTTENYDVIVVDPPAYAKSRNTMHKAVQGYKRLNEKALKLINKDGILFTFSCSQVINRQLFEDTIRAAAIAAGRRVQIIHHLSQPADHPVSIFHPEGEYLKGVVLHVQE